MAVFKCKMCGGTIEFEQGSTVGICDSCGTKQTLPKLDDDRRANLYDRANHFRRNNEFDKAMEMYESILNEDTTDAEAYWSLVLCRYGIEYVEDPAAHKRVPTVNRAQFTSVFDDDNYKSALQYADSHQRSVYEEEANTINEIQKGILAISQKEEPFDVFICYKETDNNGRRTQDSVLANDLYHQLTTEGFKVFFARITLEDKLGTAYEPYIFAALNSAKVMVVLGTKPEYFNAVWVKNEWSRYLSLVKQSGGSKILIPAYRDMDPYDLPEEFSHLQAQDMSKLGFMQDLIRGIKKIITADSAANTKESAAAASGGSDIAPLLKRAFIYLEDSDWKNADEYCERVLDIDPENSDAYLGKLLAELHTAKEELLPSLKRDFSGSRNYQKAVRFGNDRLEALNKNAVYNSALDLMNGALNDTDLRKAKSVFESLGGFSDAAAKIAECEEKAKQYIYDNAFELLKTAKNDTELGKVKAVFESLGGFSDAAAKIAECEEKAKQYIYNTAVALFGSSSVKDIESAKEKFGSIEDYGDSREYIRKCTEKAEELEAENERKKQEKKERKKAARHKAKIAAISTIVSIAVIVIGTVTGINIYKSNLYRSAVISFKVGKYEEAAAAFKKLGDYKDTQKYLAKPEMIKSFSVGDVVTFGKHKWYIINKTDNGCTILSKDIVAKKPYDEGGLDTAWGMCTLRRWLNNEFYNEFSADEKAFIAETHNRNPDSSEYGTFGGNDTDDYIFLLSIDEAEELNANIMKTNTSWWLRSPGYSQNLASQVWYSDGVNSVGNYVGFDDGVRPALNLEF